MGTFRNSNLRMSKADVEEELAGHDPEPITKYFVNIGGKEYPIKQVVSLLFGKSKMDFTTQEAYRVLKKMGYEIEERDW